MPLSRLEFSREFFQYFFTSSLIYCTVTQEGQLPFKLQFRLDLPEETRVHHSNATTNTFAGTTGLALVRHSTTDLPVVHLRCDF